MRRNRHRAARCLGLVLLAMAGLAAPAGAGDKIVIGTVPNVGDGPLICSIERGYFRDMNVEVEIAPFATMAAMTPMIARGDLAMMGGGVSVSFFNGVARGLPLRYFANRARAPVWHGLVMRKGLVGDRVKTPRDLKGLTLGVSSPGGLSEYELGKMLEVNGLSLDDVETKMLGMPESVAAVTNGAVDGAVFVPPFDAAAIKGGGERLLYVDETVKPPIEVSGLIYNSEWAARNTDLLDRFTLAYIRGARCYLEAARHGPNRAEMIDNFVKYSPIKDPALYESLRWSELDPDGKVIVDSLMDQQDFYVRRGYLTSRAPAAAIVDEGPAARALAKLGPFTK